MTFSYEARTATGAMKRGTIVAESRGGAIARIRAQGDVPVSVRECAGGHGAGGSGEGGVGRLWGVEPARGGLWA
ncbi:MAG: type II secretion system protein GspF, partial [Kiritimatiellaeota bacterium]|nr:type II secretion system protein GspF [Kiritimatiellota bacterium]